ncbi:NAD-dependent malic enzyme [Billgrantia desiderata]|uniref:NAD-dependent malic enzyme n=1 Tax=Billgrantia desiderata TaxID=52021 RepID=UPI00089E6D47|nr:NAD-dependent malic enzyme [Halomonas desiderata]MCE8011049.1 NAD-dependent malic enzyme [Halomonas desiderata]MCE8030254.1 NAD-dependent malic enzyme [Halomonas desiderata]NIC37257.1 NAD-dependent malic enzyme [Halomonas desiderata]OUE43819.1 NAD-dependent malic enzyme [Halomonas desiderata SP1]SEG32115.1 malate dehydrogenase (oxaloacetate-decarboxylating) [Halomonas desiderata]
MPESKRPLYIPYAGPSLLEMPLLNKGSAFTREERLEFNLVGLLPQNVETIEEQAERAYRQYQQCHSDLERHIHLRAIQDDNETLYYHMVMEHLEEMLPIIYTPTVGQACEEFSNIYRSHRGLFISYPDRERMDDILRSATKDKVKVIVVTDGERILGLGDQGIGGMGIPIGKLALYTACGGISPAYTLPIMLDVGTNNQALLDDPMYMGWRHPRISQEEYDAFLEEFIAAVKRRWPNVLLQFEDFAQANAVPLLERYRDQLCCFNDDVQGTAAVAVGTLMAACQARDETIADQRVVFVGAGSAGCGIAEQVVIAMQAEGLSEKEARRRVFMVDREGLVTSDQEWLRDFQRRLAHDPALVEGWQDQSLLEVARHIKPTVLIGVSGQPGLFSEEVIRAMHAGCERPVIMPLSNPTSRVEAVPADVIEWTNGQALVATGSPFPPVEYEGKIYPIAQCNNAYIFPGIGLGVVASGAKRITDTMLMTASRALAREAPLVKAGKGALLPPLSQIRELSKAIAFEVAAQAQQEGMALRTDGIKLRQAIERSSWTPEYRSYRRRSF